MLQKISLVNVVKKVTNGAEKVRPADGDTFSHAVTQSSEESGSRLDD